MIIAKYAYKNENKSALKQFFGFNVFKVTVRSVHLKLIATPNSITSFPDCTLGRPMLNGEFDQQVFEYIKQLKGSWWYCLLK